MSLATEIVAAKRALRVFKTASCEIRRASDNWAPAVPPLVVACHYEETQPRPGAQPDKESGLGYGYTVWFDQPVAGISIDDTVLVGGRKIQVQIIPPTGNLTLVDRIQGPLRP